MTMPARLGQGSPGGAAALIPRLGAGGGNFGLPQLPRLGGGQRPVQQQPQQQQQAPLPFLGGMQTSRQSRAQQLLELVKQGRVTPQRANTALASLLYPRERQNLLAQFTIKQVQQGEDHSREIMALGHPHSTAPKPGTGIGGIFKNYSNDISAAITGTMPGIYATGKAVGEDVKDIPGNLARGRGSQDFRHTRKEVLAPLAKQYAETYGPAVHGNFGETLHRVGQHPLGPALDVASIFSAGLGTAARTTEALTAVRAGRVAEIADTANAAKRV